MVFGGGLPGRKSGPLDKVEVAPGLMLPAELTEFWPRIEKSRMPAVGITAHPIDHPAPRKSSFGCYPSLPRAFTYPRNPYGSCMYPLAQICCSELPPLAGYPVKGYLQFYIWLGDYGADPSKPTDQRNFRVLYFENEDMGERMSDFSMLDEIMTASDSPVSQPHSLTFVSQTDYLGAADIRGKKDYLEIAAEIERKFPEQAARLDQELWVTGGCSGHKIGGYAYFTQSDPRINSGIYERWLLLLQIDTDERIMWGDAGVANFFIDPTDLKRLDFSNVYYHWDCC